jgi:hypothetical protein
VTRRAAAAGIFAAALAAARGAAAAEPDERTVAPVPEPILAETVTDIDGRTAGELELSADIASLRARRGGGSVALVGFEAEWQATRRLGLRLEPAAVWIDGRAAELSAGATASFKLVSDYVHDFYLQAEAGAELPADRAGYASPEQGALPYTLDLRAAWRTGRLTLRGGAGAGAADFAPWAAAHGSVAALVALDPSWKTGFFGVEALADAASPAPFLVAPDLVADLEAVDLPLRVGVALPWWPREDGVRPSFGVYFRIIVEPRRDAHEQPERALTPSRDEMRSRRTLR